MAGPIQTQNVGLPLNRTAGMSQSLVGKSDPSAAFFNLDAPSALTMMFGPEMATKLTAPADELSTVARGPEFSNVWQPAAIRMRKVLMRTFTTENTGIFRIIPVRPMPAGIDQLQVSTFEWGSHLAERVPIHGTVRMTTQKRSEWTTKTHRRGRGFVMVAQVAQMGTEWARAQYLTGLRQIFNSGIDAIAVNIYATLLNANEQSRTIGSHQTRAQIARNDNKSVMQRAREEARDAFPINKNEHGMNMLVTECRHILSDRGVTLDTVIVPFGTTSDYAYSYMNSGANTNAVSGPGGMTPLRTGDGFILGTPPVVQESSKIPFGVQGNFEDPIGSVRQFGEMFVSRCGKEHPVERDTSQLQDLRVVDCTSNTLVDIKVVEMFRASGLFETTSPFLMTAMGSAFFGAGRLNPATDGTRGLTLGQWLASATADRSWYTRACKSLGRHVKTPDAAAVGNTLGLKPPGAPGGPAVAQPAGNARHARGGSSWNMGGDADDGDEDDDDDSGMSTGRRPQPATMPRPRTDMYWIGSGAGAAAPTREELKASAAPALGAYLADGRVLGEAEIVQLTQSLRAFLQDKGANAFNNDKAVQYLRGKFSSPETLVSLQGLSAEARQNFSRALWESMPAGAQSGYRQMQLTMGAHAVQGHAWSSVEANRAMNTALMTTTGGFTSLRVLVPGLLPALRSGFDRLPENKRSEARWTEVVEFLRVLDFPARAVTQPPTITLRPAAVELVRTIVAAIQQATDMTELYVMLSNATTFDDLMSVLSGITTVPDAAIADAQIAVNRITRNGSRGAAEQPSVFDDKSNEKAVADFLWSYPITRESMEALYAKGVPIPITYLLARPFVRLRVGAAIALRAGANTGAAYVAPSQTNVFLDTEHDLLHGRFVFNTATLLTQPDNVYVRNLASCKEYMFGGGTAFFDYADAREQIAAVKDGDPLAPSIICIPTMPHELKQTDNVLDLTGNFPGDGMARPGELRTTEVGPQFAMADYVRANFGVTHPMKYMGHDDSLQTSDNNSFNGLNTLLLLETQGEWRYEGAELKCHVARGCGVWSNTPFVSNCMDWRMGKRGGLPSEVSRFGGPIAF